MSMWGLVFKYPATTKTRKAQFKAKGWSPSRGLPPFLSDCIHGHKKVTVVIGFLFKKSAFDFLPTGALPG